jgi:hypothetical protein
MPFIFHIDKLWLLTLIHEYFWNLIERGQYIRAYIGGCDYETYRRHTAPPLAIEMRLLSLPFVKYAQFIALDRVCG